MTPTERAQLLHRYRMRIRTVAVSFAAAVRSARHDLDVGAAERDAIIETWRSWSLVTLGEYGDELAAHRRGTTDLEEHDALLALEDELRNAMETVRLA
jgi:hypothetical protein